MSNNADFKYLVQVRNQVLKEGILGRTSGSMFIEEFHAAQIAELHAPPGATGFFMGDRLGGSGWTVKLADGSEETYYANLPTHWKVKVESHFADVTTQLGLAPPTTPIDKLLGGYVDYLQNLVADARQAFGKAPRTSR